MLIKYFKQLLLPFSIAFPILLFSTVGFANLFMWFTDTHVREEKKNVTSIVLEKYTSQTGGKYSHSEFIIVLQDKSNNEIFDLKVSAATFYQAEKGKEISFMLNRASKDDNIKVTFTVYNLLIFIIAIIIAGAGLASVFILFLFTLSFVINSFCFISDETRSIWNF